MIKYLAPLALVVLSGTNAAAGSENPGCTPLVEDFCTELHSPERQGNWDLNVGKKVLKIRRGPVSNDFLYSYFRGAELLLKNEKLLPKDLAFELRKTGYIEKLTRYLKAKPLSRFSIEERAEDTHLTGILGSLWHTALQATVLRRMNKRHPGFHQLRTRDRQPSWVIEEKNMYADLRMEANRIRWVNSPEWEVARKQFEDVRTEILGLVSDLKSVSEKARAFHRERLFAVTLMPPGTSETHLHDGCADDMDNAFYNSHENSVQICAGLLTPSSTLFTIAHELSHALDPYSVSYTDRTRSRLGQTIEKIKSTQCVSKAFPCDSWKSFKSDFPKLVAEIPNFEPDPAEFYRCFQRRELTAPKPGYIADHVKRWVTDDLEYMSKTATFLRLIKKDATLTNGQIYPNPAYLNPCGLDNWSRTTDEHPVNTTTPLLLYFTAEYSCTPQMPAKERLENAIETAKSLQLVFNERYAEMPGRFSSDSKFVSDGHAEDVVERVADAIGAEAVARVLAKNPDLEARRLLFYSTLSDRCEEPSWKSRYPDEAEVENKYSWGAHTIGQKRIFETLPASVRKQLQCEKDFELKECAFK